MLRKTCCIFALIALSWATTGLGQGTTAAESKPLRMPVEGMKTFYEPEGVKKDGDVVTFTMYSSANPVQKGEETEYIINCSTQEMSTRQGKGERTRPYRVLPGEQQYPIGKKLCDWGPGFWQKLMD